MEVQHGNSQQIFYLLFIKAQKRSLGCGDLENLTNGSETRKYIN